jgi:hypothetical protein
MKRDLVLKILIVFSVVTAGFSQTTTPGAQSFIFPERIRPGQIKSVVSLSMSSLPEDVIETDDLFYAPLFAYYFRVGIPANFLVEASLNSNFVTYHISLGTKWTYALEKFSFAPGYDVAFWFGGLRQFGFDSRVRGWIHYPNLTLGYEFKTFTASVKGELILVTFLRELQDDLEIARGRNFYSGFAITTAIEQPLWSDNFLLLGLKINYTKFYYPQWATFSRFNRFFFIPELLIGFVL